MGDFLLIPLQSVIARMKLPSGDTDVDALVKSSIVGSTPALEIKFLTKLKFGDSTDTFFITPSVVPYGGVYRLMLKNGFVENVVITLSETLDFTGASTLTPAGIDPERGELFIPTDLSSGGTYYLRVSYNYGFVSESANVPDWLSEACIAYSVQLMAMHQINEAKVDPSEILKTVRAHEELIRSKHIRIDPLAIKPVM